MNINRRNFLSLLDRMEKKGTLNESIEKKYILTEGVGDDIIAGAKKAAVNVSDIEFKLSNLIGGGEVKLGPSTNNLVAAVNTDVTTLANQIVDLSSKRIVPTDGFIKSSSILKGFDLFIDNFVNSDLRRLGILEGIDVGDVERLKSFLKGGGLVPESFVLSHKGIVDTVLTPLRKQRLSTERFTMMSNTMAEVVNSKDIVDLMLGLMRRDGSYYVDMNSTIENIIDVNKYLNETFPAGTKNIDGLDIGGQSKFPQFQRTWNTMISDIGKKNDITNLEKNLSSNNIKKIILNEIKNKKGFDTFRVKQRSKINNFLKRKKMKNIPKTVSQKFGGKITEADLQDAIIIKTVDGMDVFVPKNAKSKAQLMDFLKNNGIKHEGWVDSIYLGGKNTDGGKDLAQINKRMKMKFYVITALGSFYAGFGAVFYNYCMSIQGDDIGPTDDEIEYLKGKNTVQDEWFDQVLSCGAKAFMFFKNWTEVLAKKLWHGTIKGKFLLLERSIGIEIDKKCKEYMTKNNVECCNINCKTTSDEPMMVTMNGEEQDVSGALQSLLSGEAIKEWANEKGLSIEDVIQKLDTENILDGAFTEDGNEINVKGIIEKICYNTVNNGENIKCISAHLQKTWDGFIDFKGLEMSNCNDDGVKKHIINKIGELKKYESFIEFGEEPVSGKFIIKQENINGLLRKVVTGKEIKTLDELKNGYLTIVDKLVEQCKVISGDPVESEDVGEMTVSELGLYDTLIDMVMALYDQGVWGGDCDVYGEMSEDDIKDQMFYLFLNDAETGTISDSSSFYGQVDVAFDWWYPKYKVLCGEGDVTPVNPVTPDGPDDEDIDGEDDEDIF